MIKISKIGLPMSKQKLAFILPLSLAYGSINVLAPAHYSVYPQNGLQTIVWEQSDISKLSDFQFYLSSDSGLNWGYIASKKSIQAIDSLEWRIPSYITTEACLIRMISDTDTVQSGYFTVEQTPIVGNLIPNGNFSKGISGWKLESTNRLVNARVADGILTVTTETPDNPLTNKNIDEITLTISGFPLEQKTIYSTSFDLTTYSSVPYIWAELSSTNDDAYCDGFSVNTTQTVKHHSRGVASYEGATDATFRLKLGAVSDSISLSNVMVTPLPVDSNEVVICYPQYKEKLNSNEPYEIRWLTQGAIPRVSIEVSTNNARTFFPLTGTIVNTGKYLWTPDYPARDCFVRIRGLNSEGKECSSSYEGQFDIVDSPVSVVVPQTMHNCQNRITVNGGYLMLSNQSVGAKQVQLFGISGKIINSFSLDSTSGVMKLGELVPGVYFTRIIDRDGATLSTQKLSIN